METVVAKLICGSAADDMYSHSRNEKDPGVCRVCGNRLEVIPNPNYRVRVKKRDIQCTYDEFYIVSEKFKEFCEQNSYSDIIFFPTKTRGHYVLLPQYVFKLARDMGVTYSKPKECCGTFSNIFFPYRVRVRDKNFVQRGDDFIARTDIMNGDYGKTNNYEIVVGNETFLKMKEYGLKIDFLTNVYSAEYFLQEEARLIQAKERYDRMVEEELRKTEEYNRAHRWDFLWKGFVYIGKAILSCFKKREPEIVYRYGKARPMDKVTLKNMIKYPIWVMEYVETETYEANWLKPILDTCDVTIDMDSVYIPLLEDEHNVCVSAELNVKHMTLFDVYQWNFKTKDWESILGEENKIDYTSWHLKAVPSINGEECVEFVYDADLKKFVKKK